MSRRIEFRAEYGSWEHILFWGFDVVEESKTLVVWRHETAEETREGKEACRMALSDEQLGQFFRDVEKFQVLQLPCTDYDVDLTEDLYHMGVSLAVDFGERRFRHKVPTGQLVMVPTRRLAKKQYVAFASFVLLCAKRAAEMSQVQVPEHVQAKWKSRSAMDGLE
jgi:hypothetical protein